MPEIQPGALAFEVEPFGVRVTLVEPAFFATDWGGSSSKHATPLPAYDQRHQDADEFAARILGEPADPGITTAALLSVVDADEPPLRAIVGSWMLPIVENIYQERIAGLKKWEHADPKVSRTA